MPTSLPSPDSRILPALVLAVAFLAGPDAAVAQTPGGEGPPTITVEITYDAENDVIEVSRDPIRVERPGIRVEWIGQVEEWEVEVERGNRVFGGGDDRPRSFGGARGRADGAVVVPSAARGSYKYVVRIVHQGTTRVLDPEIIIPF